MAKVKRHKSDKVRICRICEEPIEKGHTSICIENCKVSNRTVDIHFHFSCMYQSLEKLDEEVRELEKSLRGSLEDFKEF